MRQLSFWARRHVWPTRLLIVLVIYPLLNFCGWCLGAWLEEGGTQLNMAWAYPLSLALLLFWFGYPSAKSDATYRRRKVFDLALAVVTFGFIMLTGNALSRDESPQNNTGYAAMASDLPAHPKKTAAQKKGLRKLMKELRARYKKTDDAGKAGLIVLAVVIAVGLFFLVAALACSAACGGAEALAYVIFIVGLAAIVFGLVRVIQRINHGPRKRT